MRTLPVRPTERLFRLARRLSLVAIFLATALLVLGAWVWFRSPSGEELGESGDPGSTAYMRSAQCPSIERTYRPLAELDPRLVCSVVYAEDVRFFRHGGIDWRSVRRAAKGNWRAGRIVHGASTIPMQLARNFYLSPERSITRKASEMLIAIRLLRRHERRRLLEIYLNSVEWAPCVYGAEAAARHYFGRSAKRLDLAEATFLSVLLPRPSHPPGSLETDEVILGDRQRYVLELMRIHDLVSEEEDQRARAEIERMWPEGWRDRRSAPATPAPQEWLVQRCRGA